MGGRPPHSGSLVSQAGLGNKYLLATPAFKARDILRLFDGVGKTL